MSSIELNTDVLYEIFKHFVAIDEEGPLTLIMVCTLWQRLVMANSQFWTWITIEDGITEIDEKVHAFSELSAGLPLQITLRNPSIEVIRFQHLLSRCQILFIDEHGASMETVNLERAATVISQILLIAPTPLLEGVYWYFKDVKTAFSPRSFCQHRNETDEPDLQPLLKEFPAIMITSARFPCTYTDQLSALQVTSVSFLWDSLSHLLYLTNLEISLESISASHFRGKDVIVLPRLHEITLRAVLSPYSDPNWAIISYLSAPVIHSVMLVGTLEDGHIFTGVRALGTTLQPKHLALETVDVWPDMWGTDTSLYRLYGLKSLEIAIPFAYEKGAVASAFMEELRLIIAATHRLGALHLRLVRDVHEFLHLLPPIPCLLHIKCDEPFHHFIPQRRLKDQFDESNYFNSSILVRQIDKLTLTVTKHNLEACFRSIELGEAGVRTLVVRQDYMTPTIETLGNAPKSWPTCIQELDIEDVVFSASFNADSTWIPFQNLTLLRCPPSVATDLILHDLVPRLSNLILTHGTEPRTTTFVFGQHVRRLRDSNFTSKMQDLQSLALDFYPDIPHLIRMLNLFSSSKESDIRRRPLRELKLPGLPHPSILNVIVSALRGNQPRASQLPFARLGQRNFGCLFCTQSG